VLAPLCFSPRKRETTLERVVIDVRMSGLGGFAEIFCSTRAFPVMTDAVEKVSRSDRRIVIPSS
jgi:hypothetical protein